MFKAITGELDDIATVLQNRGFSKLAKRLDTVSNELDARDKLRAATQQRAAPTNRKAISDAGFAMPGPGGEPNPDWESSEQVGDQFSAEHYHKVPVGKDSMSRMLGAPSPADMMNRLDFADTGKINIQSSHRRAADEPDTGGDFDEGDPLDPWTTSGLPEAGDEDEEPPPDRNQVGDTIEFYGFEEEGSLHMPEGSSSSAGEVQHLLDEAEEGEVHSRPGEMTHEGTDERAASARDVLRAAANVEVCNPKQLLHHHDPQEDVMLNYPDLPEEEDFSSVISAEQEDSVQEDEQPTAGGYASRRFRRKQTV